MPDICSKVDLTYASAVSLTALNYSEQTDVYFSSDEAELRGFIGMKVVLVLLRVWLSENFRCYTSLQ